MELRRDILHSKGAKVYLFSFRKPLGKGTDAATCDHDGHGTSGCGVDDHLFLKVRHLATLGFAVGVRHVVANERALARNCADFSHRRDK